MKVSWDDYFQYMGKNVPNHQPDCVVNIAIEILYT